MTVHERREGWLKVALPARSVQRSGWLHQRDVRVDGEQLVVTTPAAEVQAEGQVLATPRSGDRFPLGRRNGRWYAVTVDQHQPERTGWIRRQDIE